MVHSRRKLTSPVRIFDRWVIFPLEHTHYTITFVNDTALPSYILKAECIIMSGNAHYTAYYYNIIVEIGDV